MRFLLPLLAALAFAALPAAASAEPPPENAEWTEVYIETPGQPTLHGDLLRPKGIGDKKTPVIVSIGPYFAHAAQAATDLNLNNQGPQPRFKDLWDGGKIFEKGYSWLQVDSRGFGGSAGCNDFGGPGEQMDAKRAVEWAASQSWSTGKVGMWGKSYDAWTQVMALNMKPKGLSAAVIQAPIIDGYRTLYQNGAHYETGWYLTPALYQAIDATPPTVNDEPQYFLNWAQGTNPGCYAANIALQNGVQDPNDAAGFWKERETPNARGSDVPVLWSHGFNDINTKPDNFLPVWSTLKGPSRAWFGQWAHDRGNEVDKVGRDGFLAESMKWFDYHLMGDKSINLDADPRVVIQEGNGRFRGEDQWPPADAALRLMPLKEGTYRDDDSNSAREPTSTGNWSVSAPAPHDMHIAGVARIKLDLVSSHPRTYGAALLYDIDAQNQGTLISRVGFRFAGGTEPQKLDLELYPNDYRVLKGHRLGVLVAGGDETHYTNAHSETTVTVSSGVLEIPFLRYERSQFLDGQEASAMSARPTAALDLDYDSRLVPLDFPPAMIPGGPPKAGKGPAAKPKAASLRLTRKVRKGRRLEIKVRGGGNLRIKITLKRGKKTVYKKTLKPRKGVVKVTLKLKKGKYKLTAAAKGTGAPRAVRRTIKMK